MAIHVSHMHGKGMHVCDTWQAMCVTHGMPCVNMHGSCHAYLRSSHGLLVGARESYKPVRGAARRRGREGRRRRRKGEEKWRKGKEEERKGKKKIEEERGGRQEKERERGRSVAQ